LKNADRLHILDLLRFLAALAIVFYHLTFRSYLDGDIAVRYVEWESDVRYLLLAVQLFFMISGFVVCWSAEGKTASEFAWSRFVRLFPAYWFCATITYCVTHLWGSAHTQVTFTQYLEGLTMLEHYMQVPPVDLPYWTLKEELRFYGLIFVCLLFGVQRWLWVAGIWLSIGAVDFFIHRIPLAHYELCVEHAPFFIAGMVFYQMYKTGPRIAHLALLAGSLFMGSVRFITFAHHDTKTTLSDTVVVLIITGIFMLFSLVATRKLTLSRAGHWVTVLGGITYPLYLLHNRVGAVIYQHLGSKLDRWLLLVGYVSCACLAAWAIWRWIERPAARWLQRHRPSFILSRRKPIASALEQSGSAATGQRA
jgi:peptidoglycan/LPS O-acetylase OafA/YrhL